MKKNLIVSLFCVVALFTSATVFAMPDKAASASGQSAQGSGEQLSGKVLQTMDSEGYTYVYIQKKDGEKIWAAAMATSVAVGAQVTLSGCMEMPNFRSKGLNRTFDRIIFAGAMKVDSSTNAALPKENLNTKSGGSQAATSAKDGKISVTKATGPNSYTVKGVYDNSAKLNKKKVVVRGKVVKVSSGIMSRNWIHIQDGTGSQQKKNHDLVCTSKDMADVDDVVTITGTLATNKDFGGGYKYAVIVEDAKVKK